MGKDLPVGVAQQRVLDILGKQAASWQHAERIFEEHGIVVRGKRQGRTSAPQVWERERDRGGWNPGGEDGYSGGPSSLKLTPEQRAALAPYWIEIKP